MSTYPIHEAAKEGNLEQIRSLCSDVNNKFDPNQEDENGITPLIEACLVGHLPTVKALIEEYNCPAQPTKPFRHAPLRGACVAGQSILISYLLEKGADPNALSEGSRTPLMGACFLRKTVNGGENHTKISLDCVKSLLEDDRTDPTIKNSFGESALDLAKARGYNKSIELLEASLEKWKAKA